MLLSASAATPAAAGDAATADALFQAGKQLMAQKKYAEACPKFDASYKIDPTLGTLLNLADCHEKQGLLAQPWSEWGEAREIAKREGDTARAGLAERHRNALEPRVPRLTVQITGKLASGLWVYRDDVRLEPSMFNVALPVEPGPHVVRIRSGNQVLKEAKVDSAEKARDTVTLDATGLVPVNPYPYPYPPAAPPGAYAYPPAAPVIPSKPPTKRKNPGLYAGGIVALSLGCTGVAIGGLVVAATASGPEGCESNTCKGSAAVAIGGLALMAAGIPMVVIGGKKIPITPEPSPKTTSQPPKTSFIPQFVLSPAAASFRLQF